MSPSAYTSFFSSSFSSSFVSPTSVNFFPSYVNTNPSTVISVPVATSDPFIINFILLGFVPFIVLFTSPINPVSLIHSSFVLHVNSLSSVGTNSSL